MIDRLPVVFAAARPMAGHRAYITPQHNYRRPPVSRDERKEALA